MFKKLSLKLKILTMVVPLGFWLTVVSIYMLNDFYQQRKHLQGLSLVTDAFNDYGELIDSLQTERGKSAQFLSKTGLTIGDLEHHYKEKTDHRMEEAKKMITQLPFSSDTASNITMLIDSIPSIRKKVMAHELTAEEMRGAYNKIIQELMINEGRMAMFYSALGIEVRLINMTIVESLKDAMGRTRASFATVMADNDALSPRDAARLEAVRAGVTALSESPGLELVPTLHDKTMELIDSPEWQEASRNMDTVMEKASDGKFGIDSKLFFNKMSVVIEKLNELLSNERIAIKDFASIEAEKAAKKFYAVLIFVILTIIGISVFCWYVVRDLVLKEAQEILTNMASVRSASMVANSPISTMMCDPEGTLIYMNESTITNLKRLQAYIPEKVENLIGKSIDIFHKNPALQRKIISDPRNLPHKAIIALGPEKLDLLITASIDPSGKYLGAAVTWSIVTAKVELIRDLTKSADELTDAASNVLAISSNLSAAAEETSAQANTASVASEEVNAGVQTVASNMKEMVAAIRDVTQITSEAAVMSNEAMSMANSANQLIQQLGQSSMDIGNVIKVISSIAQQTNLLALNATIEAARAGEAGKGFAVVANEVKELAKQTAKATSEITKKIETIQLDSQNAVESISEISMAIEKLSLSTGNIAAAVEEQSATTNEVTRIVTESAEGVKQINENISQVSHAAANTGKDAGNAQVAARSVGDIAESLKKYVDRLKLE